MSDGGIDGGEGRGGWILGAIIAIIMVGGLEYEKFYGEKVENKLPDDVKAVLVEVEANKALTQDNLARLKEYTEKNPAAARILAEEISKDLGINFGFSQKYSRTQ
jgi:hypothetical protein